MSITTRGRRGIIGIQLTLAIPFQETRVVPSVKHSFVAAVSDGEPEKTKPQAKRKEDPVVKRGQLHSLLHLVAFRCK
jgi:hypothetical protein